MAKKPPPMKSESPLKSESKITLDELLTQKVKEYFDKHPLQSNYDVKTQYPFILVSVITAAKKDGLSESNKISGVCILGHSMPEVQQELWRIIKEQLLIKEESDPNTASRPSHT